MHVLHRCFISKILFWITLLAFTLLLMSCSRGDTEPPVFFVPLDDASGGSPGGGQPPSTDTTLVFSNTMTILEKATGSWCYWCKPYATSFSKNILDYSDSDSDSDIDNKYIYVRYGTGEYNPYLTTNGSPSFSDLNGSGYPQMFLHSLSPMTNRSNWDLIKETINDNYVPAVYIEVRITLPDEIIDAESDFTITLVAKGGIAANTYGVYIFAVEKSHTYGKAPGSNFQTVFRHSFLKNLNTSAIPALSRTKSFTQHVSIGTLKTTSTGRGISIDKVGIGVIIYDLTTKARITGGMYLP